jgi:diguanylate cyclase (GGDEF)-like protein
MLVDKLRYLSQTDDLTGMLNRRALLERLENEINRAMRYGSKLSLIICDLDYFKEINDTYGHDIGDRVLQMTSSLLLQSLRIIDILGRYGGDEFFIILPETSLEGAKEIAERIRSAISNFKLIVKKSLPIKTTASLGIAEFQEGKEDIQDFIKRADNALYLAKGKGRNRVYLIRE